MSNLFKGSAVFIFGENEINVEFTGDKNPFERVKPTLDEIIKEGQLKIYNAVERVVAKHEEGIEESSKVKNEAKWDGFVKDEQGRRMAALSGSHDRYLDQLVMAQNRAMGVGNMAGLQGIGAGQMGVGGWL